MQRIAFSLVFQHTRIGAAEFCFIESISVFLGSLGYFLVYLFVVFGNLIFNQYIGTVALLGITVVNQRVIKSVHVSRSLPNGRMHENCRIDTYDVLMQQHHALPPVLFDIVFQFHTVLTVIIYGSKSIVNFT